MANVSMAQFHQVFFEESLEGLDNMETALLALDEGGDKELVHTIFRAAHSIKGGAATFGFPEMAAFTHEAESLLDELRDGRRAIDKPIIELLLRTVDCLRGMFARAQAGQPLNDEVAEGLRGELAAVMGRAAETQVMARRARDHADAWKITFRPHPGMAASGNDPLRLLRELKALGELSVTAELDKLPALDALDVSQCHIGWTLELRGQVTREAIKGVFDWVEDECDLAIEPLHVVAPPAAAEAPKSETGRATVTDAATARAARESAPVASAESSSVRVSIDKIDSLIDLVGELVINQAMMAARVNELGVARASTVASALDELEQLTREIQDSVMAIR
ncbi:Hpt domain-containing protein, partial [Dyella sp.]|uniref:Hpt domain-containing protein n=1 Tax=Dyella sp. TaxID=1869338 RepID=UPI003F806430